MRALARKLGLLQAIDLSLSIIAPTAGMALNVSLTVQAAGRAAPLAFAIGTAVMTLVGASSVAFSQRIPGGGCSRRRVMPQRRRASGPWWRCC